MEKIVIESRFVGVLDDYNIVEILNLIGEYVLVVTPINSEDGFSAKIIESIWGETVKIVSYE